VPLCADTADDTVYHSPVSFPRDKEGRPAGGKAHRSPRCPLALRPGAQARRGLLSVLPHDRGRRLQPNADLAALVDIGALGGNSPDDVFGGQFGAIVWLP
jgi:hypothetical protein